jgi:hypothetical protein
MRSLMKRVRRIEAVVNEEDGLTCKDVELCLSCMPRELADAVLKKLLEIAEKKRATGEFDHLVQRSSKTKERSGLHGKTLELIMNGLPPECAVALKAKLIAKGL